MEVFKEFFNTKIEIVFFLGYAFIKIFCRYTR